MSESIAPVVERRVWIAKSSQVKRKTYLGGAEDAGVENTGAITYGKPSNRKYKFSTFLIKSFVCDMYV